MQRRIQEEEELRKKKSLPIPMLYDRPTIFALKLYHALQSFCPPSAVPLNGVLFSAPPSPDIFAFLEFSLIPSTSAPPKAPPLQKRKINQVVLFSTPPKKLLWQFPSASLTPLVFHASASRTFITHSSTTVLLPLPQLECDV